MCKPSQSDQERKNFAMNIRIQIQHLILLSKMLWDLSQSLKYVHVYMLQCSFVKIERNI